MSTEWNNAPLFYVLAEVRFNSIELMGKYVPEFQDDLRKSGYPDFREEINQNLDVRKSDGAEQMVNMVQRKRWVFNDIDKKNGFILFQDRIVFHSTSYVTFAPFLAELISKLKVLNDIVGMAFVERTGVRFVDVIVPEDGEIEEYIQPALQGFRLPDNQREHNLVESVFRVGDGTLIARSGIFNEGVILPPDLVPFILNWGAKFSEEEITVNAHIDIDHFVNKRFPFDISTIEAQLNDSKRITKNTFTGAITEYAVNKWE